MSTFYPPLIFAIIILATQSHGSFLCFTNSQCNLTQFQQIILQDAKCCQYGGQSYSTLEYNDGQAVYGDCMHCQFVLNITIIPSKQHYTTSILFSPWGGGLILSFHAQLNLSYFPLNNTITLPTTLPFPKESTENLFFREGSGEAIEYSRLDQRSGSLTSGIIRRGNDTTNDVPSEKFLPTVRNESYYGTVLIIAEYLLASAVVEVGYEFVVLECLECSNDGQPNSECTECNCKEGFVGRFCDDHPNTTNMLCRNDTCQNKGACNISNFGNASCHCVEGFNGSFCEYDVDECSAKNNTCGISGECQNTFGSFVCVCNTGFTGVNCETDIDECQTVLCGRQSTCVNKFGSFQCVCNEGYTGELCDSIILPCERSNCSNNTIVCINGQPGNSEYICVCKNGFEGFYCENDIDECENSISPCLRGGTCINTIGGYNCYNQTIVHYDGPSLDLASKIAIGFGTILILFFILMGVSIIIAWIAYLLRRYRRTVRYYARHVMVEQLEEERLYANDKKMRHGKYRKNSRNQEFDLSFAINPQAEAQDAFIETIL